MSDVYKDTMKEIFREAPQELVTGFKKKMGFIQDKYQHSKKTVQSCLEGMADPPTLVELLAAAYLVNGGLLFKHEETEEESGKDSGDLDDLLSEMDELSCGAPPPLTRSNGTHFQIQ